MKKYTEGISENGTVILEDGLPIPITRILELLNSSQKEIGNSDYEECEECGSKDVRVNYVCYECNAEWQLTHFT